MRYLFLCLVLFSSGMKAQNKGVKFETGTLAEVLAKSGKEKKLVFVDTYTAWCSACKWMDKTTFCDDRVADFMNTHFVNIKFDTEKGEGIEVKKRYPGIYSYPTYLILDTTGREIHRIIGGGVADDFIRKVKAGMNPQTCLSGFERKIETGKRDRDFLLSYLKALDLAGQYREAGEIAALYICSAGEELADSSNWYLFRQYVNGNPWGEEFKKLLTHKNVFIANNGKNTVEEKVNTVLLAGTYELIFGNREYSIGSAKELRKMIRDHHPADSRYMLDLLHLAKAKQAGKVKKIIKITNRGLMEGNMGSMEKCSLFDNIQETIMQQGKAEEQKSWKRTLNKAIRMCPEKQGKIYYQELWIKIR